MKLIKKYFFLSIISLFPFSVFAAENCQGTYLPKNGACIAGKYKILNEINFDSSDEKQDIVYILQDSSGEKWAVYAKTVKRFRYADGRIVENVIVSHYYPLKKGAYEERYSYKLFGTEVITELPDGSQNKHFMGVDKNFFNKLLPYMSDD